MLNEKNRNDSLQIQKKIQKPKAEVFKAISEGRLFLNCGADSVSMEIDFKVGGHYKLKFLSFNVFNTGEYLEIVPNEKIVFTWCQDYDSNPTPDTVVTITLEEEAGSTILNLNHSGFKDLESLENHTGGWNGGLTDLTLELCNGQLKLMRKVNLSVESFLASFQQELSAFKKKGDDKFFKISSALKESDIIEFQFESMDNKQIYVANLKIENDDDSKEISWLGITQSDILTDLHKKELRHFWDQWILFLNSK